MEIVKLMAEQRKLNAEAGKMTRETFWYPVAVATGLIGTVATVTAVLVKLLCMAVTFPSWSGRVGCCHLFSPGKHKTNTLFQDDLFQVASPMKAVIHPTLQHDVLHAQLISYGNLGITFARLSVAVARCICK